MTILFAGSEWEDFDPIGPPSSTATSTSSTNFRSGFVRGALTMQISSGTQNTNYARKTMPSTFTSIWATFRVRHSNTTSTANYPIFMFGRSGTKRVGIVGSGTTAKLRIAKVTSANSYTTLQDEAGTFTTATNYKYDIQIIDYTDTVNGTINVWRSNEDGTGTTLILTYTGDLTTDSETLLEQIFIGSQAATSLYYYSEIIVSTIDTRGMGVVCMEPLANGNTFNWTGSEADIDEAVLNDADLITANADGDLAQVTLTTTRIGTPNSIRAFVIAHRTRAGSSVPNVTPNLRINSTNYFGTQIAPSAGFANYQEIFQTNPDTGVAFIASDLTTAGVNYGLRANT